MNVQPGVLDPLQEQLDTIFLNATTLQGRFKCRSEDAVGLMEPRVASELIVTIGFGSGFVGKCSPKRRPKPVRSMPSFEGDEYDPAESQADIVVQICRTTKFANHTAGKTFLGLLSKVFTSKAYHQGFTFPGSCGVLGFIDGTANLGTEDWPRAVLVGDNRKLRVKWPTGTLLYATRSPCPR